MRYFIFIGSVAYLRNRISPKNAVRFAVQILQGLEWIHSKNVVHADIKPDNCLITTSNNVVISDFGSAFYLEVGFYRYFRQNTTFLYKLLTLTKIKTEYEFHKNCGFTWEPWILGLCCK